MTNQKRKLRAQFGKLGMYLVDQAKDKIKELNQQTLFRKGEIKKKYREREERKSKELRKKFIDDYNHILNTNLSTAILNSKDKLLEFKNKIIKDFINDLHIELEQRINKNYSEYQDFIFNSIKSIKNNINEPENVRIYFNSRDIKNFKRKIGDIIGGGTNIKEDPTIEIGGFKIEQIRQQISFNYTLDNIIQENYSVIETKFAAIITDSEIKELQTEFEEYISEKKKKREDILVEYDRI
jgi:vacuolar-type H+-ATPase subunit E/Vma4